MKSRLSKSSFNLRLINNNNNLSNQNVKFEVKNNYNQNNQNIVFQNTKISNENENDKIKNENENETDEDLYEFKLMHQYFDNFDNCLLNKNLNSTSIHDVNQVNNKNNYAFEQESYSFKNSQYDRNLTKSNSKSVANLYFGNNSKQKVFLPKKENRQVAKRKNSINIKQFILDRILMNKSGSLDNTTSSNQHLNKEFVPKSNDFIKNYLDSCELKEKQSLNKFKHLKPQLNSQSTFDLRCNKSFKSTNELDIDLPDNENKLVVQNSLKKFDNSAKKINKFNKKLFNLKNLKKISQSLSDLREINASNFDLNWKEFGDAYQNEIKERRHEMYITEIEMDTLHQIGPTLRAIYDGDEYDKFMERLDLRIKSHDKDIERMCNAHYQGFVDCIHELLKFRPQAGQIKKGILEINSEMQKSSENILRKAEEIIKFRRILCNTKIAIEHLTVCLPVLEMYGKLNQQMEENKYYPALKTLEQLELNFLPRVSNYRFAQSMCIKIPQMRKQIKEASMRDIKDFLETVRKLSFKIGEVAMKSAAFQQNIDDSILDLSNQSSLESSTQSSPTNSSGFNSMANGSLFRKSNNNSSKSKKRKAPLPPNSTLSENNETDFERVCLDEELSATDLVDFSPVYRCLHIYGCLGDRDSFEQYYRQQRQQQAKLTLQAPMNMHENIEGYKNYFCGIVGFFVIEDHILTTGNNLVTKEYLDTIWENSLQSIIASLRTNCSFCKESKLMLQIKRIVVLFIHTLQSYGYNVNQLYNLLLEIRDQYNEILTKQWTTKFRDIFDADNYHPMVTHNLKELNNLLMEFPFYEVEAFNLSGLNKSLESNNNDFNDIGSNNNEENFAESIEDENNSRSNKSMKLNNEFVKKFPFSSFVPKVFREVKNFIQSCLEFSHDLNTSQLEIEDMVRKSTNILLTRTLSGCLSALIKKPNLGLLQLIQITINTNYLEEASVYLEDYITKIIGHNYSNLSNNTSNLNQHKRSSMSNSNLQLSRLQGKSMFKDARNDAESQIYLQLNQKISEFLELASYDWMMVDPTGIASSYILDLIAFLRATFESFTNLPLKVAQTACHSACKFIANSLMDFLRDEKVKCISLGAINQFNLDLLQSEMFAGSEPVKGFEDGALLMCFSELRQLMDLFIAWDWSTYFADYGKQHSRYLCVNPVTALSLLEKVKEAEKKKNTFVVSLKKNERDKKKLTDIVIKQLRQLVQDQQSSLKNNLYLN